MPIGEKFDFEAARFVAENIQKDLPSKMREQIKTKGADGMVLGSGLGGFAGEYLVDREEFAFGEILAKSNLITHSEADKMSKNKLPGHAKKMIFGRLKDSNSPRIIVCESGREHPYEGVSTQRATFWIRVMQAMKVESLIGSNASGILTPETLNQHDLMLIHSDQDLGNDNPLIGPNDPLAGERFPHMGDLYPEKTRELVRNVAAELGIGLSEGMYLRVPGPNYERREDVYRMRRLVNDLWRDGQMQKGENRFISSPTAVVGMSSTFEQIVAQHGTQSKRYPAFQKGRAYISLATNYAAALNKTGNAVNPNHAEVEESAKASSEKFGKLIYGVINEMRKQ